MRIERADKVAAAGRLFVGALAEAPPSDSRTRRDAAAIASAFLGGRRIGSSLRRALKGAATGTAGSILALPSAETDGEELPRASTSLKMNRDYKIDADGKLGGGRVVGDELRIAAPLEVIEDQMAGALDGPRDWSAMACKKVLRRWGIKGVRVSPVVISDITIGQKIVVGGGVYAGGTRVGWVSMDGHGALFLSSFSTM